MIFTEAFSEKVKSIPAASDHDFHIHYDHDPKSDDVVAPDEAVDDALAKDEGLWPGCHGQRVMDTVLLRTCRRIYLETANMPALNRELSSAYVLRDLAFLSPELVLQYRRWFHWNGPVRR